MQLRNAVDEAVEQLGRLMRLAIPALIGRGVVEAEIGAEIDEGDAARDDVGGERLRLAVGQGGEDEADAVQRRRRETLDRQPGIGQSEMGMDRRRAPAPAWLSPNSRAGRKPGWPAQSRSSSAPTKPDAPRMATSIISEYMR